MKNKRLKILFYLTRFPGVGGIENVTVMVLSKLAVEYDCTIVSHLWRELIEYVSEQRYG